MDDNNRESGGRILKPKVGHHPSDEFSQDAAANKPPAGIGNSEGVYEVNEKTRKSDGVNPAHPSTQQESGVGPAMKRHSKDA